MPSPKVEIVPRFIPAAAIVPLDNAGGTDIFVVKYDSNGVPLWARRISGGLAESFRSFIIDSTGNVIVSGTYTSNPVTIYGGGDSIYATLDNPGLSTTTEAFIVKYNSSGTPQWVRRIGGTGNETINFFTNGIVLSGEDIIVSGTYTSNPVTIFNADGNPSFTTLANAGTSTTRDSFITKYNSSGTPQWARRIGGIGREYGASVVTDSTGNIIVTGYYNSTELTIYGTNETPEFTKLPLKITYIDIETYSVGSFPNIDDPTHVVNVITCYDTLNKQYFTLKL
jgi:hypothetical protein